MSKEKLTIEEGKVYYLGFHYGLWDLTGYIRVKKITDWKGILDHFKDNPSEIEMWESYCGDYEEDKKLSIYEPQWVIFQYERKLNEGREKDLKELEFYGHLDKDKAAPIWLIEEVAFKDREKYVKWAKSEGA